MATEARRAYVEAQLHTAPPQRLRLMLIEAAIGFVTDAGEHARATQWGIAGETFVQARRAVIALLKGVTSSDESNRSASVLAEKIRALYGYEFRLLTEAQLYRDSDRLDDALRLLEMERETWREVCQRTGESGHEIDGARIGAESGHAESFSMRA
jgi:flagellar protein FliS